MSQAPLSIGANKPGLTYRQEDTLRARAIATHHAGAAAPAYTETHIAWMDTSGTPWKLKIYDGADWITTGEFNAVTDTFIPYVGTSPIRLINHVADTGVANAYVLAPTHAVPAYSVGQIVTLRPVNANTGACTLALSALSAKAIKLNNGNDPHANALRAGGVYALMYDGVNWQLLNPTWPFGGLAFLDVLDEDDFASDSATRPPSQQSVKQYLADNGSGALEHLASATASASAALDFTGIFDDGHVMYEFVAENITATLAARTSTDGGTTFTASANAYVGTAQSVSFASTPVVTNSYAGATSARLSSGSSNVNSTIRVFRMSEALPTMIMSDGISNQSGGHFAEVYKQIRNANEINNAIRFMNVSGNISGTIHCYGLRNS